MEGSPLRVMGFPAHLSDRKGSARSSAQPNVKSQRSLCPRPCSLPLFAPSPLNQKLIYLSKSLALVFSPVVLVRTSSQLNLGKMLREGKSLISCLPQERSPQGEIPEGKHRDDGTRAIQLLLRVSPQPTLDTMTLTLRKMLLWTNVCVLLQTRKIRM